MPKTFWPEAVNWTVHVLNKSPLFALKNKTLEEAWSGLKPSVRYFKIFGCISHVHVPDCKREKLDDKSVKCVFLRVSEESKGYRLYNPISQRIIISIDVVFEEDNSWDWNKEYEDAIRVDLNWDDDGKETDAAATANEDEAEIDENNSEEQATNDLNGENSSSSSEEPLNVKLEGNQLG